MKQRPKITWTNPSSSPSPRPARRNRSVAVARMATAMPLFYVEPQMNEEARKSWDEICQGSPIAFVSAANISRSISFPLPVLKQPEMIKKMSSKGTATYVPIPSATQILQGTFAIYLGMSSVKMKRSGNSSHVEGNVVDRAFRTVLIGQNKYLLDDPNMIRVV